MVKRTFIFFKLKVCFDSNSDAPTDWKIKTHMIWDLLNLSSIPCTDPAIYSNKQRQQKADPNSKSEQIKRVSSFFSLFDQRREKKNKHWNLRN
jgi:hypothetical protein